MSKNVGRFIISLDFEMFWGMRDKKSISTYGEHIKNENIVIPQILQLFKQYNIHATWAVVGFLLCDTKLELENMLPSELPTYEDAKLNPYPQIKTIGESLLTDPYHFSGELISTIVNTENQELATHTFSHYYCLEPGQILSQFDSDIKQAVYIAKKKYDKETLSIVFPRNQYGENHLTICYKHGIKTYRGNPEHWAYNPQNAVNNTIWKKLYRFCDTYLNLSGHNTYVAPVVGNAILNIRASQFLRPFSRKLFYLEWMKLHRITNSMQYAARTGQIYHLWWHPHNFGKNIDKNLELLEKILKQYKLLNEKYGMLSCNMAELI
ncbi:MAG: uncharacterized protein K0R14_1439 [Burkholderiales bacterium]|jgi:peptidoglycan/xylan/chitin deacetylase (PgdA/CDA1 family)|nr:uncharacterized protein [Burkholderiales bacterium]